MKLVFVGGYTAAHLSAIVDPEYLLVNLLSLMIVAALTLLCGFFYRALPRKSYTLFFDERQTQVFNSNAVLLASFNHTITDASLADQNLSSNNKDLELLRDTFLKDFSFVDLMKKPFVVITYIDDQELSSEFELRQNLRSQLYYELTDVLYFFKIDFRMYSAIAHSAASVVSLNKPFSGLIESANTIRMHTILAGQIVLEQLHVKNDQLSDTENIEQALTLFKNRAEPRESLPLKQESDGLTLFDNSTQRDEYTNSYSNLEANKHSTTYTLFTNESHKLDRFKTLQISELVPIQKLFSKAVKELTVGEL